jgi:hypothetical protein
MNFRDFCATFDVPDRQAVFMNESFVLGFTNSTGKKFSINPESIVEFLKLFLSDYQSMYDAWSAVEGAYDKINLYEENPYRAIYKKSGESSDLIDISSLGGSQTLGLTKIIAKYICFMTGEKYVPIKPGGSTFFEKELIEKALRNTPANLLDLRSFNSIQEADPELVKNKFMEWLRKPERQLSETSVKSYAVTGINRCQRAYAESGHQRNLYLLSYQEALDAFEIIKSNESWASADSSGGNMHRVAMSHFIEFLKQDKNAKHDKICLSKAFVLLPGISGTGKSRLVRMQAPSSHSLIVPVRPDWHEPSDLLGYVSRITGQAEFVSTDTLRFMVKAWKDAFSRASSEGVILKQYSEMHTFWLCLDEMNLAPVEQYFADYLSVLESRKWDGSPDTYSCDPILRIPDDVKNIRSALGLDPAKFDGLWSYFSAYGMPLPPNLIVAGTVNMDETTHGFSRKVIDRALTFDFGEFFPNDFGDYFAQSMSPVKLSFPTRTHIDDKSQLAVAAFDNNGEKSIAFLSKVNDVLKGTSFELAYRALNELLLSVHFHAPGDDSALKAVWDDFIMMKVLPRIEGDNEKLASRTDDNSNVIQQLEQLLLPMFPEGGKRTDFYRVGKDGVHPSIEFRSIRKLRWMQKRLNNNGFTSFWP